jgi:drug/metabolite transporter (DMT)-like permease
MDSRTQRQGIVLCLASAVGFGAMAIFAKAAYHSGVGVVPLLATRFLLAAVAFWLVVAVRRPPLPARRDALAGAGLGLAGYAAQSACFFAALRHVDAGLASLLLYVYPALVFAGAVALRRERARAQRLGALGLATAGVVLVLVGGGTGALDGVGVLLGLGAALAYSGYILAADGLVKRVDPFVLAAIVTTAAGAGVVAFGGVTGQLAFGFRPVGWAPLVGIALVSTVIPMAAFLLGLQRVGPATASIVSTIEPAVTVGLAVALLGETLGPVQLLGGAVVLLAVVLLQRGDSASVQRREPAAVPTRHAPARALASNPA